MLVSKRAASDLYETDFHGWAEGQARLLRERKFAQLDVEHIAEELDGLAKTQRKELVSHLARLLKHLLKWWRQPERRGTSWRLSIENARIDINEHLQENPSLQPFIEAAVAKAYRHSREEAVNETGLDVHLFPQTCPWAYQDFMANDFWP